MSKAVIGCKSVGVKRSEHFAVEETSARQAFAKRCRRRAAAFTESEDVLRGVEDHFPADVLCHCHPAGISRLKVKPFLHEVGRGVSAAHALRRPNASGLSMVEPDRREGGVPCLGVTDIPDSAPLLDIRPCTVGIGCITKVRNGRRDDANEETGRRCASRSCRGGGPL